MSKLQDAFSGWVAIFEPGEDFETERCEVVLNWEEVADKNLDPYESPTPKAIMRDASAVFGSKSGPLPFQLEQSRWAGLSMAMQSLAYIVGGEGKGVQINHYDGPKREMSQPDYNFQFHPGETGHQEGRL